jgi:hypothetical protein
MKPFCLSCFSADVEERGGGRIRKCRSCGAEAERGDKGSWRITKEGWSRSSFLSSTAPPAPATGAIPRQVTAPPSARPPTSGPVSRGALELVDGLRFSVAAGLERLARSFREDFAFVWRCIPPGERAALKAKWAAAGGISIWVLPAPLISPAGHGRANGYVVQDDGGVELAISSAKLQTVGHLAVLCHELAHAAGEHTELGAWGVAHGWLKGTGMPAAHAFKAFLDAGGRDVEWTGAQARRWGFGIVALGGQGA